MTKSEANKIIEELRGRFDAPFSSADKDMIEKLYSEVLGKNFVPTSCQQCYHDALIECYLWLKSGKKMAEKMNYRLKAGAIINCPAFQGGKIYTNDNLSDKVAADFLAKYPQQVDLFQKLPDMKVSENDDAYKRLSADLDSLQEKLDKSKTVIEVDCKDVADKYTDIIGNLQAAIDSQRSELEESNAKKALNASSTIDTADVSEAIDDSVSMAKGEQEKFNEASEKAAAEKNTDKEQSK